MNTIIHHSNTVFTGGKPLPSDDVLNALFSRLMVSIYQTYSSIALVCVCVCVSVCLNNHRIR